MKKIGHDVEIEPHLQPLDYEIFTNSTCIEDEARLDISAKGIRVSRFERSFYDVKIFKPSAPTNRIKDNKDSYLLHENLKCLKNPNTIVDIERGFFSPLIFATTGGASPITHKPIRRIPSLIAQKSNERYSEVVSFIRTRVSFSLLKSTTLCIRGCRGQKFKLPDNIGIEFFNVEVRY